MEKRFVHYLVESEKTYKFRIKLAGLTEEPDNEKIEKLLEKYGLVSLSKAKKTPIQEHPLHFQTLGNVEVYICEVEIQYPTTSHELYNYLQDHLGIAGNQIVVINSDHPTEIAREEALSSENKVYKPLLDTDYDDDSGKDKPFGDDYNVEFLKSLKSREYELSGGKPKKAQTTNDIPQGTQSPLTKTPDKDKYMR